MSYRSSASFGKRQEFAAIAELLKRRFDVYLTLVDDQQIDCVVRKEMSGEPVYMDIEIKARSNECNPRNAGTFAALEVRHPRRNFFFIFYSEPADTYWIVPSLDLVDEANEATSGQNQGRYRIMFTNYSRKTGAVKPRPRFEKYQNNFDILAKYVG